METLKAVLEKVNLNAQNMTESEPAWKLTNEWKNKKTERSAEVQRWKDNPTISFTEKEISDFVSRTVSIRFLKADKKQIDPKIWKMAEAFYQGAGLYLWGKPGTGKTHLCSAIIREYFYRKPKKIQWLEEPNDEDIFKGYAEYVKPPWPILITIPSLLAKIKASFGQHHGDVGDNESEAEIIDKYCKTSILFLDDIGVEKTTDWAQQTLYLIIDYRYREMLQTVITSNLSLNELSDKTGDRITSRIAEMCAVIELKGKDRRIKKQAEVRPVDASLQDQK